MRDNPHLYELNARVFLRRLRDKHARPLRLATVPEEEWESLAQMGFDLVWFMGIWQRSEGSRQKALHDPDLRRLYDLALAAWTEEDVAGSPYAVHEYRLDSNLGGEGELGQLRAKLNRHGLGLVVDFIPNHLAFDHAWTLRHPTRLVSGTSEQVSSHADWFFTPDGATYLAHGRDPNFPPWTDTVQLNLYSADLRQALIDELVKIAEVADGVRCDMAMLALNRVFEQVWGPLVRHCPPPETEFWADAIGHVKRQRPDFVFLAEAYWGLERELQGMGFDYTYDKGLYDRLRFSAPDEIRRYLEADCLYQRRSARFIENHDEPRAAAAFGPQRGRAAAAVVATLPGLRLFHDGQLEGRQVRLPVQLVREPDEAVDPDTVRFYDRLLAVSNQTVFHEGEWTLMAPPAGDSGSGLLAWVWRLAREAKVVVVNYSSGRERGWVKLPAAPQGRERVALRDELTGKTYASEQAGVPADGLHVDLGPWQACVLGMASG